ncbi:MAG: LytR/AlgR family response regulator transcription factor [Gemmatimonadaceae bacterium]
MIRVLVVDDEPLNRVRIEDLLSREADVEVVGSPEDGVEAVEAIRALHPDLVFLDVQMPGRSGLDVVREIGPASMPATIFVTAFDRYAVDAFDVAAVDYLVKPFDDERFEEALRRARRTLALGEFTKVRQQLLTLLGAADVGAGAPAPTVSAASATRSSTRYLERIPVDVHGTVRPIMVGDIDYITADGPYAELHVAGRKHLIRESMQVLEEKLDPRRFMRVHRSAIVRLDLIDALKRRATGDAELLLKGGARIRVSRTRRGAIERWLGIA